MNTDTPPTGLNKILDEFVAHLQSQGISSQTAGNYQSDLRSFARWFEQTNSEQLTPQAITPTVLREYRRHLLDVERRKANTINRRMMGIKTYLKWAKETGQIERNPASNIKSLPRVHRVHHVPRWLDKREQYALQQAVERDLRLARLRFPKRWVTRRRDASIVILLLHTGLRMNEALNLRIHDIELADRSGLVTVRHSRKGSKQRSVPLNRAARQALRDWLDVRPALADNDYLFPAVEGCYKDGLTNRSAQRVIRRYGEEAGLSHLTPHILRHTFAKNLANQGVGLEQVAALLGHASLDTTRIYVAPDQRDLENAVEK